MARAEVTKRYSAGIYARLSVDGDERKKESVETQIEIAKAFMEKQKDMKLFDCYTDIGKSGTNFKREGFERMMQDVKMKKIDCIIVKDLSRLGRNHIETGNYIEKIFPLLGVRFVAVTDHFDSMGKEKEGQGFCVNLKNLVNEMYARDIAVKASSARRLQWEQGSFAGGAAPYGYCIKQINGRKCLLPKKESADIVKKIFEFFAEGKSMREIVRWLFSEQVVCPAQYHRSGQVYGSEGETIREWSAGTVKAILTNPVYTGCLVWRKQCALKEHTHEAIIGEELFLKAARRFEDSAVNRKKKTEHLPLEQDLFEGVLFCGNCGASMKRTTAVKVLQGNKSVRTYSYNCPKAGYTDGKKCEMKSIPLPVLERIIKEAVGQEAVLCAEWYKSMEKAIEEQAECRRKKWEEKLLKLGRKVENAGRLNSEQYQKYRKGEQTLDSFKKIKERNDRKVMEYQKEYKNIQKKLKEKTKETERAELTEDTVRALIQKIEVYPAHRVRIDWKNKEAFGGKVSDCNLYPVVEGR